MATNTLTYDVVARDRASKTLDTVGKKFGALSKSMGLVAGAAAGLAVIAGARMLKGFVEDAAEAAKVSRITANAIKVTGSAAKVTTKQVEDLSEALSNKTAVDDELIQSGANLLLTFKNIRNEAGAGNKIFNYATQAAIDLSAAGFGSVESAAKMLGKALNDPLKGLTALGKAGVTFSDQQKETIAKLVEQGDILGAQKIIMQEIATQVGGAAEAAASPMDKLKTIMANLGEELGAVLLPYLEDFATWMLDEGVPKAEEFIAVFRDEWIPVIKDIADGFKEDWWPVIKDIFGFLEDHKDVLGAITAGVIAWTAAQWLLNIALAANPIGAIILGVAALVAAIVLLVMHWEEVKLIVEDVWEAIKRSFEDGVRYVANTMLDFAEYILDAVDRAFGWIPVIGDHLDTAKQNLVDFRQKVNTELSKISDEDIVINIKPGGLERVAKSAAASYAARYQGPGGLARGQSSLYPFTPGAGVGGGTGGSLGISTTGLNAGKVAALAAQIGDQAGDATFAQMQVLFKAGRFASLFAAGPGIPGSGRLFPLPAGTYRRTQGPHDGGAIDYGAPYGTPIRASFTGSLDISDLGNRSYGKFYRLFGPGQRSILGAHLSSFAHGDGPISRGQLIGRVGSTGNSTGPHLHLLGFDKGGWLPPGLTLAYNGTGKPERITNGDNDTGIHVHLHGVIVGSEKAAVDMVVRAVDTARRQGRIGVG